MENLFQMLVEMVGICFFGYMIGTIQALIHDLSGIDFNAQQEEMLDIWLMKLDKAVEGRIMCTSIFTGVRDFKKNQQMSDPMSVQDTDVFKQLKPRMQKVIIDVVFKNFYELLKLPF